MEQSVLGSIRKIMNNAGLMPGQCRILAAVSGGADSVCLLLALAELGYDVQAVHVEHGIRGAESLEDCAFVRRLCRERGITVHVKTVDVLLAAKEESMSLEEAARSLRWKAMIETADRLTIPVIATAHHRMDQAETVLWNLIRGSSVAGLGGIRPVRKQEKRIIIRPLIECERAEIEEYLRKEGVSWRTDSTNSDMRMTRNSIRHQILPLLLKLNPGAVQHISQAADDLRQIEDWIREQTDRTWESVILENGDARDRDLTADRNALKQYPGVIRTRLLRRMIAQTLNGEKDISRAHVSAVDLLVSGPNGHEVCLPDHVRAVSEEGVLRLTRRTEEGTGKVVPLASDGRYFFPGDSTWADPYRGTSIAWTEGKSERATAEDICGMATAEDICGMATAEDICGIATAEGGYESNHAESGSERFRFEGGGGIIAEVSYMIWPGGDVPKKRYTKYLAYDTMAPCPVLRTRREGDYLIVNSASGRKKLKDYLIDEKVPRSRRDRILLVAQESHVLWVVGMRISEGAKVRKGVQAVRVTIGEAPRTADAEYSMDYSQKKEET